MTVTWLSHECHMTVTWLSHECHMNVTWSHQMNVSPVFAGPFSRRSPRIWSFVRCFSVSTENTVQNTSIPHRRLEEGGRGGGREGGDTHVRWGVALVESSILGEFKRVTIFKQISHENGMDLTTLLKKGVTVPSFTAPCVLLMYVAYVRNRPKPAPGMCAVCTCRKG